MASLRNVFSFKTITSPELHTGGRATAFTLAQALRSESPFSGMSIVHTVNATRAWGTSPAHGKV